MKLLIFLWAMWGAIVNSQTITPIWFPHGLAGGGGACSYDDGSSGAPAGAVTLYPNVLSAYAAHGPNNGCKWPDQGYGIGATGLGTPAAITSSASGTTTLTFSGGVPGYFATGQSIVDISAYPNFCITSPTTITAIAATTITVSQAVTCPNGDKFATFHPATCNNFGSTCVAYSPPTGVSIDTTNHLIDFSGANRTITGIDTSFDGGYAIYGNGAGSNVTISNVYGRVGTNKLDPVIINVSDNGGTITDSTFDGNGVDDGNSQTAQVYEGGVGVWTISYVRVLNAGADCFNQATLGAVTNTPTQEFTSCINNGVLNPSPGCAHADLMQGFGTSSSGILVPTFKQNFWIIDGNNKAAGSPTFAGGQGWSCGDTQTCENPDVETNLLVLSNTGAGVNTPTVCGGNGWTTGINHPFAIDRTASLGTAQLLNNWVDMTGVFVNFLTTSGSGGTITETGNINIVTGATLT